MQSSYEDFRKAVIAQDFEVVLVFGTLTWLDDVADMKKESFDNQESKFMYEALLATVAMMEAIQDTRDLEECDIYFNAIGDLGFDLYIKLITMLSK